MIYKIRGVMGADTNKNIRGKVLLEFVRANKLPVIFGLITLLVIVGVSVVVSLMMPKLNSSTDSFKVGETSITKEAYKKLESEGKSAGQDANAIESVANDMLRAKEVARQLDVVVPNYLIAGQQNGPTYVPYEQMSSYARAALYPQALKVLVALQEKGGSIATIYQLQYNSPALKLEAEEALGSIPVFSEMKTATDDGVHGSALLSIYADDRFYKDDNKSGIYAVTDEGQIISILSGEVRSELKFDTAASVPSIVTGPLTQEAIDAIKTTKENGFSSIFTVTPPDSYMLIYKDKRYPKTEGIQARYNTILSQLEVKK